jgi:hypothetical protein
MKNNAWKKDWFVVMHEDYDNTWTNKTKPLTYLQAIRFVSANNWNRAMDKGTVRIVSSDELSTLTINA